MSSIACSNKCVSRGLDTTNSMPLSRPCVAITPNVSILPAFRYIAGAKSEICFMILSPTIPELMARARADLRMGLPVVVNDSESWLILAAETLSSPRLDALEALGGEVDLAVTARRAETLKARAYDGDVARIVLPDFADLGWVQALADPADDLAHPMKGPLHTRRDGDALVHRAALQLCKAARLLPAALAVKVVTRADVPDGLTHLPLSLIQAERSPLHPVVHARLPMTVSETGRVHVFRPDDGGEEHFAIEIGRPDRSKPVLTRLHSACFTGDLLGSLKCDCGPQLRSAMATMGAEGAGVLLYLNQEGRGIGLANKMRAYTLQDQGFDTVDANHRLGFEDDERDFRLGSDILKSLRISSIRLLTNNPVKVAMMEKSGISVAERVPLRVGETAQNKGYLATKAAKSGHLF